MQVGETPIPDYRLTRFLGSGTFGEVWQAAGPTGHCALKFMARNGQDAFSEFTGLQLVQQLDCAQLLPLQKTWLSDSAGYLHESTEEPRSLRGRAVLITATPLGECSLLQQFTAAQNANPKRNSQPMGLPEQVVLEAAHAAAKALDFLNQPIHYLGRGPERIIHGNLKPSNLIVVNGEVRLADSGLGSVLSQNSKRTFNIGAAAYAAPELINNEPTLGTDQYALAILYFELRTGHLPFNEHDALVANLMGKLDLAGISNLREREVIRRATGKHPHHRFASCEEMVKALDEAVNLVMLQTSIGEGGSWLRSPGKKEQAKTLPPYQVPGPLPPNVVPPAERYRNLNRIGDYPLHKILGRGGNGIVYRSTDPKTGADVAIKVIDPEFVADLENHKRFHREAQALRGIVSENVVSVLDSGDWEGIPFLVMPLLQGYTLEKFLQQNMKQPLGVILRIGLEVAEGLSAIHASDIIHRDVKPSNIWMEYDSNNKFQRCKLIDFGVAQMQTASGSWGSSRKVFIGTPAYMSPEQANSEYVDSRTDLFSLGIILYEMITGKSPFAVANQLQTLARLASVTPPAPMEVVRDTPKELSDFTMAMIARRIDQRPRTAVDVVAAFKRFIKKYYVKK